MARIINRDFKVNRNTNIQKWWFEIQDWYSELEKKGVCFCGEYSLIPWENFQTEWAVDKKNRKICRLTSGSNIPKWWSEYNKVKHCRINSKKGEDNYSQANLINLSNAFAALYILERNTMNQLGNDNEVQMLDRSSLFENKKLLLKIDKEGNLLFTYDPDMEVPKD